MAYPKDSTISSQISEYDNVPRLPSYYYPQNIENNRRAFDPSYEIRSPESTKPIGVSINNTKNQNKSSSLKKMLQTSQQHLNFNKKFHRFPNNDSMPTNKEENCLNEFYQQKSSSFRKNFRNERLKMTPKIRPVESAHLENCNWNHNMGRGVPSVFFYFLVFLAEILLFGVLILSLVWVQFYQDGFGWRENVKKEFNLHPVLMITGFIFLMGHAMLVYRLFGCCNKLGAKLLHTILYLMAVPCIVVATIAVFDSHDLRNPPIPNLYSLHSWMGVVTIGLFALQLFVGFFSFWLLLLCEQGTSSFRASLVPIHSSFGLITFMLAVATCVTGLTEKALFSLKNESGESTYKDLPIEAFIINAIGTGIIALGIIIPTLVGIRYFRSSKYHDEMSAHL